MELLYVWIGEFRNIHNQGFNISPKHYFEFSLKKSKGELVLSGQLHHDEIKSDTPSSFFNEKILNITAIVGKNGTGKTTFLNFISSWIGNVTVRHIVAFKDINSEKIFIYHNEYCEFELSNRERYSIQPFTINGLKNEGLTSFKIVRIFSSATLNPIDFRDRASYDIEIDISTNFLLKETERRIINERKKDSKISLFTEYWLDNIIEISNFLDNEGERYSNAILKLLNKNIGINNIHIFSNPLTLPNYFNISLIFNINELFTSYNKEFWRRTLSNGVKKKRLLFSMSSLFVGLTIQFKYDSFYSNAHNILVSEEFNSWCSFLSKLPQLFEFIKEDGYFGDTDPHFGDIDPLRFLNFKELIKLTLFPFFS